MNQSEPRTYPSDALESMRVDVAAVAREASPLNRLFVDAFASIVKSIGDRAEKIIRTTSQYPDGAASVVVLAEPGEPPPPQVGDFRDFYRPSTMVLCCPAHAAWSAAKVSKFARRPEFPVVATIDSTPYLMALPVVPDKMNEFLASKDKPSKAAAWDSASAALRSFVEHGTHDPRVFASQTTLGRINVRGQVLTFIDSVFAFPVSPGRYSSTVPVAFESRRSIVCRESDGRIVVASDPLFADRALPLRCLQ